MKTLEGTVLLVQEGRFMVETDAGASHLFLLSPHASAEPQQLPPLGSRHARVRVRYAEGSDIIGYVAHRIDLLGPVPA